MKAAQIQKYSKNIEAQIVDIPIPTITDNEVLVKVKVAAVNSLLRAGIQRLRMFN